MARPDNRLKKTGHLCKEIAMYRSTINFGDASVSAKFRGFELKMEAHSLQPMVINTFKHYYTKLLQGDLGKLPEAAIEPVDAYDVRHYDDIDHYTEAGIRALRQAVIIKLNGGLGTSMGLEKAKSLITLKNDRTFLDFILGQVRHMRERFNTPLPLVLMNSFKTHADSMLHIDHFDNGPTGIPLAFVQNRFPKVLQKDFSPASWPDNPELEWNPPGHGDLYSALVSSGLLQKLLRKGVVYAFISNSDNLGAVMDPAILGFLAHERLEFLMEVARRTHSDRKGGHLAKLKRGDRLTLREVAQCPEEDMPAFTDIERHCFFNTNSLWLNLRALEDVFLKHHIMPLDLIVNPKTLDPRNPDSPPVYQIETAMGAAISAFERAAALEVPRVRFAPVKTTADLLLVQSDRYVCNEDDTLTPNPAGTGAMPDISLDSKYYKKIDEFQKRLGHEAPSLLDCTRLDVQGDVWFGDNVRLHGDVLIKAANGNRASIEDNAQLTGSITL